MSREIPKENGVGVIAGKGKPYLVKLRRGEGWIVKPEAEQIDGKIYVFRDGWPIYSWLYKGEQAMVPNDFDWPADAPSWIASGDLAEVE